MRFFSAVIAVLMLLPLSLNAEKENNGLTAINDEPEVKKNNAKTENTAPPAPRLLNDILPDLTQVLALVEDERFSSKKTDHTAEI